MFLPRESCVSGNINTIEFLVWMKRAYMRPHMCSLSQMMLAIRTFESLRYATFISVMTCHVTAVFVAAVALGTGVTIEYALAVAIGITWVLHRPFHKEIWKKNSRRLVRRMCQYSSWRSPWSSRTWPAEHRKEISLNIRELYSSIWWCIPLI